MREFLGEESSIGQKNPFLNGDLPLYDSIPVRHLLVSGW